MNRQANPAAGDGRATTTKTTFSRETSVSTTINADTSIVWALLTNAADIPRWNSTITSVKGDIREGETIELKSMLDEKRTFKLKVKEFVPEKRLVWGDGQGNRVYTIDKSPREGRPLYNDRKNRRSAVPAFRRVHPFL